MMSDDICWAFIICIMYALYLKCLNVWNRMKSESNNICYADIKYYMQEKNRGWNLTDDQIFKDVIEKMTRNGLEKYDTDSIQKYGDKHYEFAYRVFKEKAKDRKFIKNHRKKKYYFEAISAHQKVRLETSSIDKMLSLLAFVSTVVALAATIILGMSNVSNEMNSDISIVIAMLLVCVVLLLSIVFPMVWRLYKYDNEHDPDIFYDQIISRVCEEELHRELPETSLFGINSSQNCGK